MSRKRKDSKAPPRAREDAAASESDTPGEGTTLPEGEEATPGASTAEDDEAPFTRDASETTTGDDDEGDGPDTPRIPDDDDGEEEDFQREVIAMDVPTEPKLAVAAAHPFPEDVETTVSMGGDAFDFPLRDDLNPPPSEPPATVRHDREVSREHLKGMLEALVFASDAPLKAADLARLADAPLKDVKLLLTILKSDYAPRGIQLDEVAGGWLFRTHPIYGAFVRDMTKQKPVKLSRAQIETLAILAYRQPITRPEIDEIRGVDCGPVLKVLLDRDLIRILGKRDEPGRPILYGTTNVFLEFFGLKSLKDLPTLREFTELNEESRRVVEQELGDVLEHHPAVEADEEPFAVGEAEPVFPEGAPAERGIAPDTDAEGLLALEEEHEPPLPDAIEIREPMDADDEAREPEDTLDFDAEAALEGDPAAEPEPDLEGTTTFGSDSDREEATTSASDTETEDAAEATLVEGLDDPPRDAT